MGPFSRTQNATKLQRQRSILDRKRSNYVSVYNALITLLHDADGVSRFSILFRTRFHPKESRHNSLSCAGYLSISVKSDQSTFSVRYTRHSQFKVEAANLTLDKVEDFLTFMDYLNKWGMERISIYIYIIPLRIDIHFYLFIFTPI